MKNMMKFVCLALVIVTLLAVTAPAFALSGSYKPYLGDTGTSYNIRSGHSGPQVKNVQMLLNETIGTSLAVDGIFGPATESAVEYFQTYYLGSWASDGIVGNITKGALWSNCPVKPDLYVVYPQFQ